MSETLDLNAVARYMRDQAGADYSKSLVDLAIVRAQLEMAKAQLTEFAEAVRVVAASSADGQELALKTLQTQLEDAGLLGKTDIEG